MTIPFVAIFVLALALIVVPRIQRSRRVRVRRPDRRVALATAAAAPATSTWGRSTASRAAPIDELDDEWDDDLGWGEPAAPA
ncbi:MAG TPA: hypothetical protein VK631_12355, partial [Solirubrobacteraceae bacterium]|nr:hypothetical protein [Solirubrobacteraceae bacterium]